MGFNLFEADNDYILLWEVLQRASSFLERKGKSPHLAEWLFKELNDLTYTDLVLNKQKKVTKKELQTFETAVKRLLKDEPPQYIVGHEWFFDRKFLVDESVLIPRPETEEMVDLFLKEIKFIRSARLLDIGTGSGAIGVTLALENSFLEVTATDISTQALALASKNAEGLTASVRFLEGDMFEPVRGEVFDFIISNPPYISKQEWEEMDHSVQKYEPEIALFAQENGLAWYRSFAQEAPHYLNAEGMIFLEIGYRQGNAVKELLSKAFPERKVVVKKDLAGKDRFVIVK